MTSAHSCVDFACFFSCTPTHTIQHWWEEDNKICLDFTSFFPSLDWRKCSYPKFARLTILSFVYLTTISSEYNHKKTFFWLIGKKFFRWWTWHREISICCFCDFITKWDFLYFASIPRIFFSYFGPWFPYPKSLGLTSETESNSGSAELFRNFITISRPDFARRHNF